MSRRNFGNPTSGLILQGNEQPGRSYDANSTRVDPNSFPLPQASILQRQLDHVQESQPRLDTFELGSRVFVSVFLALVFLVPMICVGIIMGSR